ESVPEILASRNRFRVLRSSLRRMLSWTKHRTGVFTIHQFRGAFFSLAALFCLALAGPAPAQRLRGELHLEIRDPKGASVAAQGELLSEGNAFRRNFQIPNDGHYVLPDLPFGMYRLNLNAEGFASWSDVVNVHSEVPLKLGVTLGVAPVTTQVQVTDELTLVDPTRTSTLFSIGQQTIREQLSLQPGRDVFDLVNQEPGWIYEGNGV